MRISKPEYGRRVVITQTATDVVLSYTPRDTGLASLVVDEFRDAGLEVFQFEELGAGGRITQEIRGEIVECSVVVFLVTRSFVHSPNLAFEIGLAMAWSKPIYIVYDGLELSEIPEYLSQFRLYPLSQLETVIQQIREGMQPFSEEQRQVLGTVYRDLGVPADRLLTYPPAVDELVQGFEKRTGVKLSGDRLIQELLRQRKRGELPSIGTRRRRAE